MENAIEKRGEMLQATSFRLSKILTLFMFVLLFGCGGPGHRIYYEPDYTNRYYVPKQIPITAKMMTKPEINICKIVVIVNNKLDKGMTALTPCQQEYDPLGAYTHKWWGNLHLWTDTAMEVLKMELEQRGVKVVTSRLDQLGHINFETIPLEEETDLKRTPRTLKLAVTRACLYWGFHEVGCPLNLRVQTGNGAVRDFPVSNKSVDLYDSCDSAITKAVAAMLEDDGIRSYLTCPDTSKDSDCDGVPDEIDECPGTPPGVKVNSRGCPLDTDCDGVPDYLDKCPGTRKGIKVDSKGCPLDSDGDGVADYLDQCPGTPRGVQVDRKGCPIDSDGDKIADYKDKCPGTQRGINVDSKGCPVDSDGDGVPDYLDRCPGTPEGINVDKNGCPLAPKNQFIVLPDPDGKVGEVIVTSKKGSQVLNQARESTGLDRPDDVPRKPEILSEKQVRKIWGEALDAQPDPPINFILYFHLGTTELTSESLKVFPEILAAIKSRKSNDISIAGHTDRVASEQFNRGLSFDRAKLITEMLVTKGIDSGNIDISFFGEALPLVKTLDGKAEPRNRRVEVTVR